LSKYDAVVVGSGPNGLAAAITLGRQGLSVLLLEAKETIGGGMRTLELTIPGFKHDVCSAIHPLGKGSPFFRTLGLEESGLEWIQPDIPMAHPLDDGSAATMCRSVEETAATLGRDGRAYQRLMAPLVADWDKIAREFLGPLRPPRHPLAMARFGLPAIQSAKGLAESRFQTQHAQALFAGSAAHAILPLEQTATAAFGLMLAILGHAVGWPIPKGGSQEIANGMASYLETLGCRIETGVEVKTLDQLPPAQVTLMDVTPRQLLSIAGDQLPNGYRRRLEGYRYGPGIFKMDWALDGPIPWTAEACHRAGTVHLGGTLEEIAQSERQIWRGKHPDRPYVIVTQSSQFDETRAPEGKHTAWAYCHVPHGSEEDMTERVESQIERFAPGFADQILARHRMNTRDLHQYNGNYIGGDINGGVQDLRQLFTRPVVKLDPYSTPVPGLYICSSSTPPGGGVHGMCGYHAARSALRYFS
jgi:phytoene dehydrogenase-like protein